MARNIYNMMGGTDPIVIQWNNPDIAGLNELARLLEWSYNMLNTEPSNNTPKTVQLLCAFHLCVFKSLEIFTKNDPSITNNIAKRFNNRPHTTHEKKYNKQKDLFRETWKIDFFKKNAPYSTEIDGVVKVPHDTMNTNAKAIIAGIVTIMTHKDMKERVKEQYATHDQTFYNNWSRIFYMIHKKWPCYKGVQPISIQLPTEHKTFNTDEYKHLGEILDRINGSTEFDPLHDCTNTDELVKYGKAFHTFSKFNQYTRHNNGSLDLDSKIVTFKKKYCLKDKTEISGWLHTFITLSEKKSKILTLNTKEGKTSTNNIDLQADKRDYQTILHAQFNAYKKRCEDRKQAQTLKHTSVIETTAETDSTNDWEVVTPNGGRRRTRRKTRRRTRRSK